MLAPGRVRELIRDRRDTAAAVANAITALTNGLSAANQKLVFMLLSQAFEERHFKEREVSLEIFGKRSCQNRFARKIMPA